VNKKRLITFFIAFSGLFLLSKWHSNEKSLFEDRNSVKRGFTLNIDSPKRLPSSLEVKSGKQVKKKLLPPKPIVLYINEQRNLRRKIANSSRRNRKVFKGKNLSSHKSEYKILDNFFALPFSKENHKKYPDAEIKLNHLIIEVASDTLTVPVGALKVTQNRDSGAIGIMTGVLKVKLKDFSLNHELFDHSDYTTESSYDYISLIHYKFDDIDLVLKENDRLKNHPNVSRVSLEILEFSRHSR
jgi:hypothetical protein